MVQATDHKSEQMICSLSMLSQIPGIIPNANMCTLFISMVQQPKLSRKVVLLILSCISFVPNGVWDKKLTAIMEEDGTKKQVSSFYISGVERGSVSFHFLGKKKRQQHVSLFICSLWIMTQPNLLGLPVIENELTSNFKTILVWFFLNYRHVMSFKTYSNTPLSLVLKPIKWPSSSLKELHPKSTSNSRHWKNRPNHFHG